jgi:phosphatidylglycerophosphate synthase
MEIHPSIMGKLNTFLLLLTVTVILLSLYDPDIIPKSPLGVGSIRIAMLEFLILLTALTTVVSGLQYVYRGFVWFQDRVQTSTRPS